MSTTPKAAQVLSSVLTPGRSAEEMVEYYNNWADKYDEVSLNTETKRKSCPLLCSHWLNFRWPSCCKRLQSSQRGHLSVSVNGNFTVNHRKLIRSAILQLVQLTTTTKSKLALQIAKFIGPTYGAHLGPVGPRWAPCWPHEPCYQSPHYWSLCQVNPWTRGRPLVSPNQGAVINAGIILRYDVAIKNKMKISIRRKSHLDLKCVFLKASDTFLIKI